MAVSRVGSWAAMVDGSDPTGSLTVGSGSNRMFVSYILTEQGSQRTISTYTVGGQAASYTAEIFLEAGADDQEINVFIWNEIAVAAMSGSTVSYTDGTGPSKLSWTYATYKDVKQASPTITTDGSTDATQLSITSTSVAADMILAGFSSHANVRAPFDYDTLTEQADFSVANHATGVADGSGGDSSTLLKTDEVANSDIVGLIVVLTVATSGLSSRHSSFRGICRGTGRGIG